MPAFRQPEHFILILKCDDMNKYSLLIVAILLTACGYKGDLYLPKPNDNQPFGIIQTGLTQPAATSQPSTSEIQP